MHKLNIAHYTIDKGVTFGLGPLVLPEEENFVLLGSHVSGKDTGGLLFRG